MTRVVCAVVSESRVEIPAVCEVHSGSGRLAIRREGDRIVLAPAGHRLSDAP